jgi:glycerol-3-phosphate dehydrogenase
MKRTVEALRDGVFDVLVLGGGINGAGVALDATLRGFRVALIDKGDFASGTSSASSKLVHGGLRYLEHGNFRLVFEALHERRLLLQNAPHLVRPLRFLLPFYLGARVPPWKWRIGLTLYDLLAGQDNLRRHRSASTLALRREFPALRSAGLLGGASYYDAQMDDARLCLEVVRSAAARGACVANYVEAIAFEQRSGAITSVRALDRVGGGEVVITARQVVNASGPWLDAVCRLAGDATSPRLQPTKGVHLLAPDRGLSAAFLFLHPEDGRVFFVIPWLGKTLIGTTDTWCDTPADNLTVTAEETDYLLRAFNHYLSPPLAAGDLLGHFAGLRPLLRAGSDSPASASRDFHLFESPSGLLSVGGGKYTTYRHVAEVVTDRVAARFGHRRRGRTRRFPLDGTPPLPWAEFERAAVKALDHRHGLGEEAARHLVRRYGRRAEEVAAYLVFDPELARPVVPGEPDLEVEFVYQREQEMAIYPADCLLRRTRLGLFRPELLQSLPSRGMWPWFAEPRGSATRR